MERDGSSGRFFHSPWSFIIAWQVRSANAEIVSSGLTQHRYRRTELPLTVRIRLRAVREHTVCR